MEFLPKTVTNAVLDAINDPGFTFQVELPQELTNATWRKLSHPPTGIDLRMLALLGDGIMTLSISHAMFPHGCPESTAVFKTLRRFFLSHTVVFPLVKRLSLPGKSTAPTSLATRVNPSPQLLKAFLGQLSLDEGFQPLHEFVSTLYDRPIRVAFDAYDEYILKLKSTKVRESDPDGVDSES